MGDTFAALPDATADGSVVLAKNSDREPNEAQQLLLIPAGDHHPSDSVRATHIAVPQVRRTHRVLLAKPYWVWGAEMGVNEHGVAIGTEAVFTKIDHESEPGLLGMDLLRLGLERGATAEEAAEVVCQHLERYGQSGQAGHTRNLQYHSSFLIADPRGAVVLETAGRDWVIERVHRGSRSIANALTIGAQWDSASPGLDKPGIDIAEHYSDFLHTRFSDAHARQSRTTQVLSAGHGTLRPADAMALLRDHGEDGESGRYRPSDGLTGMTICSHAGYGPIRDTQSVGAMVAHLRADGTTVWLTGTSGTCLSAFKPVWLDGGLPDLGPAPSGTYDPGTLWWRYEDLHRAVLRDYRGRAPLVRSAVDDLEAQFWVWARECEPSAQARADLTARCFGAAAERLAPLKPHVLQQPVRAPASRLYRRAWRNWDQAAHR